MKHSFLNHNKIVAVTNGTAVATTGAVNSDWVSMKHGNSVVFTVIVNEGRAAAADDNTVTLRQARTAAGGGAKALVPRRAYRRAHATDLASAAEATPVEIARNASGAIDIHVDGDESSIIDIEVDASELDVNDGFAFVQARLAAVGSSTTTAAIIATVADLHHAMDPVNLPNVLA